MVNQLPIENPLRAWLKLHEHTQESFARAAEVSLQAVSRWCRNVNRPPDEAKLKIHEVTMRLEIDAGARHPRGVAPADWFPKVPPHPARARRSRPGSLPAE